MADQPVTREKLINADIDVDNLGKAVNEKGVVNPRYGDSYPTLPSAIQKVIETGGFEPFATEAALKATVPVLQKKASYALDTHKIFLWENGAWVDTGLSALDKAIEFTKSAVDGVLDGIGNVKKTLNKFVQGNIGSTETGLIEKFLPDSRIMILQVKPETRYVISKTIQSQRYVVALYSGFPYSGDASTQHFQRVVKDSIADNVTIGDVSFSTDSSTRYVVIYVSRDMAEEPVLNISELNLEEKLIVNSQNLCDPYYVEPFSISFDQANNVIFTEYATNKTHVYYCDGVNQLSLTRVDSDRFRLAAYVVDPISKVGSFIKLGDFNDDKIVIDIPEHALYLLSFIQASSGNAQLQILESSDLHEFSTFKKYLKGGVDISEDQKNELIDNAIKETSSKISSDLDLGEFTSVIDKDKYLNLTPDRINGVFSSFSTGPLARTYIIPVDGNSSYSLSKLDDTSNFIVLELAFYPLAKVPGYVIRTINDSATQLKNGELNFVTTANAAFISVTTSVNTGDISEFKLLRKGLVGGVVEKSINLLNPIYMGVKASIQYVDDVTNPFTQAGSQFPIYSLVAPVNPNTQYCLSLDKPTSRFKVILINRSENGVVRYRNVIDQDGAIKTTFETDQSSLFVAVYYTNQGEIPLIQLEIGTDNTEYQQYGLRLNRSLVAAQGSYFPIAVVNQSANVTLELQRAFNLAANSIVYISPGNYDFDRTLNIPSHSKIIGLGEVNLRLTNTDYLEAVTWRGKQVKTYLKSDQASQDIFMRNITVTGCDEVDKTALHFGVCIQGNNHSLKDVSTKYINWEISEETENGERRAGGNGWGLVFYNAKHGRVSGGVYEYGGYENVGTENAEDIIFEGINCGVGWRTSFQIHRNCKKIKLVNSNIVQRRLTKQAHSALTIHGSPTEIVDGVLIDGNSIDSETEMLWNYVGGIQLVEGGEHNVTITNNDIKSSNCGVTTTSPESIGEGLIVNGNRIQAGRQTVRLKAKNSLVSSNILKGASAVQFYGDDAETCVEVNNVFIPLGQTT
ncbi:hypothetical protein HX112_03310 [Acinetobacter towneri]|uniref:hypothetical protein n=1 Tax=Acinetobacter towneri TaxID=202956 RepID=UPI002575AAE8|nr:hypothetical protein [Acinetobacter towneri]MDM1735602.1 hypothetical protein [Acinetobacter towneri]